MSHNEWKQVTFALRVGQVVKNEQNRWLEGMHCVFQARLDGRNGATVDQRLAKYNFRQLVKNK